MHIMSETSYSCWHISNFPRVLYCNVSFTCHFVVAISTVVVYLIPQSLEVTRGDWCVWHDWLLMMQAVDISPNPGRSDPMYVVYSRKLSTAWIHAALLIECRFITRLCSCMSMLDVCTFLTILYIIFKCLTHSSCHPSYNSKLLKWIKIVWFRLKL